MTQEYEVKSKAWTPHGCLVHSDGVTEVAYSNWKDSCVKRDIHVEQELLPPVNLDQDSVYKKMCDLWPLIEQAPAGEDIAEELLSVLHMLLQKNISYGNSALEPIGIFSKGDAVEQINSRIDDKLNRIKNEQSFEGDNDESDLIGYLVLRRVARKLGR